MLGKQKGSDMGELSKVFSKTAKNIDKELAKYPDLEEVIVEETDDPNVTKVEHVVKYVNGTEVRLRRNPSLSSFVMATFDTGQEVTVTGTSGDWTAVTVDNQKGYIYSSFLSDTNPLESGG